MMTSLTSVYVYDDLPDLCFYRVFTLDWSALM